MGGHHFPRRRLAAFWSPCACPRKRFERSELPYTRHGLDRPTGFALQFLPQHRMRAAVHHPTPTFRIKHRLTANPSTGSPSLEEPGRQREYPPRFWRLTPRHFAVHPPAGSPRYAAPICGWSGGRFIRSIFLNRNVLCSHTFKTCTCKLGCRGRKPLKSFSSDE